MGPVPHNPIAELNRLSHTALYLIWRFYMEPHPCLFCQVSIVSDSEFCSTRCEQKYEWSLKERELIQELADAALKANETLSDQDEYDLAIACEALKKHRKTAPPQ